jgi:ribosome biogenesis GTPase
LDAEARKRVDGMMDTYRKIGYRVLEVSSQTREGMEAFEQALVGRISIFAGQSGVGKSSLLNALLPASKEQILGKSGFPMSLGSGNIPPPLHGCIISSTAAT